MQRETVKKVSGAKRHVLGRCVCGGGSHVHHACVHGCVRAYGVCGGVVRALVHMMSDVGVWVWVWVVCILLVPCTLAWAEEEASSDCTHSQHDRIPYQSVLNERHECK